MNASKRMQLIGIVLLMMPIVLPLVGTLVIDLFPDSLPHAYDNEGNPITTIRPWWEYGTTMLNYQISWIPWAFTFGIAFLVYGAIMRRRKAE